LGVITRRLFLGAVAGVCLPREHLVLEAIAAERMPHRMVVSGIARAPFFELRDYGAAGARVVGVLRRCGIRAVRLGGGRFLFPFDSVAARESAWRAASADPRWIEIREGVVLREIAIYRASS
jgi:hypothetical protein